MAKFRITIKRFGCLDEFRYRRSLDGARQCAARAIDGSSLHIETKEVIIEQQTGVIQGHRKDYPVWTTEEVITNEQYARTRTAPNQ